MADSAWTIPQLVDPFAVGAVFVTALIISTSAGQARRVTIPPRPPFFFGGGRNRAHLGARKFAGRFGGKGGLDVFCLEGQDVGIVGRVVGASYAVLIADELFACGCKILISLTSAGQISPAGPLPYFVLINRALRDEGTSYHYAPPSEYADADPSLIASALNGLSSFNQRSVVGSSWTTDAPFRETEDAIAAAQARGILAVEMEAAALYSFAKAAGASVLCLAQVTNTMGTAGDDFRKGRVRQVRLMPLL